MHLPELVGVGAASTVEWHTVCLWALGDTNGFGPTVGVCVQQVGGVEVVEVRLAGKVEGSVVGEDIYGSAHVSIGVGAVDQLVGVAYSQAVEMSCWHCPLSCDTLERCQGRGPLVPHCTSPKI